MHYEDARALLLDGRGRERATKKVGNNTVARLEGDDVVVRLHATDILRWTPPDAAGIGGELTFDTGGWYSVTTKQRMNHYGAPFGIHAEKGTWYLSAYLGDGERSTSVPFYDGLTVLTRDITGTMYALHGSPDAERAARMLQRDKLTKKRISAYLRGLTADEVKSWTVDGYSALGDCLFCAGAWSQGNGSVFGGTDHLESHLDERYYMLTLTMSALREVGYRHPEVIVYSGSVDMIRRALRRYLEARLLVGPSSGRRQSAEVSNGWA